jgi:deazaflavin-dependent oxidoreductase (nitroreductase family)
MSFFESKPSGVLRLLFRLPIALFKLHLGWLLDHRFLLLTHRGRTTGRVCRTVLEVIRYDAKTGESIVISGYGKRADWFRNIEKTPALSIAIGSNRFEPVQHILSASEAYDVLEQWQRQHPLEARIFRRLYDLPPEPSENALSRFVETYPLISFRSRPHPPV